MPVLLCPRGSPRRLHLTERAVVYAEEFLLLQDWCEETQVEVEIWPDTRDMRLTPPGRDRLEQLLAALTLNELPGWEQCRRRRAA